jgi:hypothetical protein
MSEAEKQLDEARAATVRAWNAYQTWIAIAVCAGPENLRGAEAARDDARRGFEVALDRLQEVTHTPHTSEP